MLRKVYILRCVLAITLTLLTYEVKSQIKSKDITFENVKSTYRDSLYKHHFAVYQEAISNQDTSRQINSLLHIANYYGMQAKYKDSYDHLWIALELSEKSNDLAGMARVNQRLARHFGFYGRKKEGLEYYQKVFNIQKARIKENPELKFSFARNYHSMCSFYRDLGDITMQKQCLDSAKNYLNPSDRNLTASIGMEEAVILTNQNEFSKAEDLFNYHFEQISNNNRDYLVLFEYYQGVNYYHLNKISKAEAKLKHALTVAYNYNAHLDFVPKIYKMLSLIYMKKGESEKGIDMLNKLAAVNFNFFDSRSDRNKSLLEIQNEHRLFKEKQQEEIQALQLEELESTRKLLFFQRTMLIVGLLVVLLMVYFYLKYLNKKYKLEKYLLTKKREIELQKVQEVIELKNKELATTALRLIEKDEIVDDFSLLLKKNKWTADAKTLKSFVRSWDSSLDRHWDEFQKHFTDVNNSFYKNLHKKYPKLSASDDKLCALIKLKLSSKEISRLMGLSNESVHTKRSRLRSKLGLDRSVNLTEFMENF